MTTRKSFPALGFAALLFMTPRPPASAERPTSTPTPVVTSTVVIACVGDFNRFTRIVQDADDCLKFEHAITWNIQGIPGATGPAGPQGFMGLPGPQGPAGMPGAMGSVGPIGLPGPAGAVGQTGPVGPSGATGGPGATGPQGPVGSIGPAGPQGSVGLTGAQGIPGPIGITGAPGPQGGIGPAGPIGPPGQPGQAGPTGLTGPAGPAGPTGPTGLTGPAGPAGSAPTLDPRLAALGNLLVTVGQNYNLASNFGSGETCTLGDITLSALGYSGSNRQHADGSIVQINQNTALFSLLGTSFGGNGTTNFALPDLRAAEPLGTQYAICIQGIYPNRT